MADERKPFLIKGVRFLGPDGQGYRLTRDVFSHERVTASMFEAFGGAPDPVPGAPTPKWLADSMREMRLFQ